MLKCPNTLNIYYSQKEHFELQQVFICLIVLNMLSQNISKWNKKNYNLSSLYVVNYFKYFQLKELKRNSRN